MSVSEHQDIINQANEAVAARAKEINSGEYLLHYHLTPPANWMNDPNGLIHYKGEYHLFYQHYPYGDNWGPMHWGHAKSGDLAHWEHLPIALAPSEPYDLGEKDGYGCWSGSAIEHDGKLFVFYTGHVDANDPKEVQCMAVSGDGIHFDKFAHNPVISNSPDGECFGFRDPKVWKRGEFWYMVIGSGKDGKGRALLYRSGDLIHWEFFSVAAESDGTQGDMWECPDLFPLGDKHVLLISPMNMDGTKNLYFVGDMDYETGKFQPEDQAKLDDGFDFYAAQTFPDSQGRRIVIGWMDMWGSKMVSEKRGIYGAMTIPRQLLLTSDGTVAAKPVPELESLREQGSEYRELFLFGDEAIVLEDHVGGGSAEFILEMNLADCSAEQLDIKLCSSENELEETLLRYVVNENTLYVDRDRSGIGDGGISAAKLPDSHDGRLKIHAFLDRSSLEVFVNDGLRVLSNRIYPRSKMDRLHLTSIGGPATIHSISIWKLKNIWK